MKVTTKPLVPFLSTTEKFASHNLSIQPAQNEDFSAFVNLISKIYSEFCPELLNWYKGNTLAFKEAFYGHAEQDERRVFYSIKKQKDLVGSAGLIQYNPNGSLNIGEMTNVYLLPEYRGNNLEETLADDLIKKARMFSFDRVLLTTRAEFKLTIELCNKLGFVQIPKPCTGNSLIFELKL